MQNILISALFVMFGQQLLIDSSNTNVRIVYFLRPLWHILIVKHNIFRNLTLVTLGKTSKQKKLFNSGISRITQTPHPPIRATLPTFSGRQKRRFARMAEKNTDDDNNCCHDNFDQNFGNFDDNDDKNY